MPTPTKGPRLGGSPAHERLMLANLATALFEHGRIQTTETKAKRLRPLAERLITFAKRGDLHARRQVLTVVRDKSVVHTLFAEIGPRFAQRPGGYTRIVKIGPRKGDNAPMAVIELVDAVTGQQSVVAEAERSRGTRFARRPGAAPVGEAPVPATPVTDGEEPVPVTPAQDPDAATEAPPVEAPTTEAHPTEAPPVEALTTEAAPPSAGVDSLGTAAPEGVAPAADSLGTEATPAGGPTAMTEEGQEKPS